MQEITLRDFVSSSNSKNSNLFVNFYWLTNVDDVPSGWYVDGVYRDGGNVCTVWINVPTKRAIFWERNSEGSMSTVQVAMPGEY